MFPASTDAGHDLQIFLCFISSSEAAGNLDFTFVHSQIPFGLIIVERGCDVIYDQTDRFFVLLQSVY